MSAHAEVGLGFTGEGRARERIRARVRRNVVREAKALGSLAWPLALASIGHNIIGFVDTALVGRLGANELAGVAAANAIFFTFSVVGMGLAAGLDPIVSQAVGAGEGRRVRAALRAGILVALIASVPLVLGAMFVPSLLVHVGVSQAITDHAVAFATTRAPGLLPFVMVMTLRSYFQARGSSRPLLVSAIVANLVNVTLNLALIFGVPSLAIPALGVAGSGIASTFSYVAQIGVLLAARRWLTALPDVGSALVSAREVLRLGIPIAVSHAAEVFAFAGAGILAGRFGAEALGGHQIALQYASLSFTSALAISSATSTRVGHAVGRGDKPAAVLAASVGISGGLLFMVVSASAFLAFAEPLARLASNQPEIIAVTVSLLMIAASFQIFDGLQVLAAGALRGLGDTRITQRANLLGYYVFGLPLALLLSYGLGFGVQGLWWGLSAGLAVVSAMLLRHVVSRLRGPLVRTA